MRARRTMRRKGARALPVLAGLLIASAVLRLGDGRAVEAATELLGSARAHAADTPAGEVGELDGILAALKEREAALEARAAELDERAAVIAEGEAALAGQLAEIEAAEERLRALVKLADTAAEDDLARLAAVYESMKPAEAGRLFEQMPPAFAAGFLSLMRPEVSAAILAQVPPDIALAISVVLAGRNATNPPIAVAAGETE